MMKALSVIELAQLYRMNRQSIYKRINKGDLSKNSDGKIDLSEAIRIFGEPSNHHSNVTTLQSTTVQKETEVDMLKQQINMLKQQLVLAHEREIFQREQLAAKDNQIEAIQRLLEVPKTDITRFTDPKSDDVATFPRSESESNDDEVQEKESKRIPIPEHVEEEPPKRGFWSKFFKP